jgi:biotin carboxyl carrier protein
MRLGRWLWWLKWPAMLTALGGLLAGAYFVHVAMMAERTAEADDDAVRAPRRARNGVVTLSPEQVEDHGIKEEPAHTIAWSEPVTLYGRVVPNPRTSSVVQAPFAGTVRADARQSWPMAGARVRAGQVLGQIDLRVGPQERLDLRLKRDEAGVKARGAEKTVAIQQERLDRLEKASQGGEIVAQRELDEARVLLTEARTNLEVARATEKLWADALDAIDRRGQAGPSTYRLPLLAPGEGEVVETAARPGMEVEAGAILARIVNFRRPLARMDLPAEVLAAGPPTTIELTMLPASPGRPPPTSSPLTAELVGPAPRVDPTSQFTSFWYEAKLPAEPETGLAGAWRPGRFVTALVRLPDAPKRPAVVVPATAVLVHEGRHLVYVREGPGRFERREVQLLGREDDRVILSAGVQPGEGVVVRQAQVLLSEEFRGEGDDD